MDNLENDMKNIETDTSSGSPSIDNTFSDNNVRNRVSSWLTEIVGEVRKKGASVSIPKWVDTSNTGNPLEKNSNVLEERNYEICDNSIAQEIAHIKLADNFETNLKDNNLVETEDLEKNRTEIESETSNTSRFWNKFSFDRSSSTQNQNSTNSISINKVSQIKTFGKNKFTEIYEKVKIGKEKLPILKKSPTTMDENLIIKEMKSINEEENNVKSIRNIESNNQNITLNVDINKDEKNENQELEKSQDNFKEESNEILSNIDNEKNSSIETLEDNHYNAENATESFNKIECEKNNQIKFVDSQENLNISEDNQTNLKNEQQNTVPEGVLKIELNESDEKPVILNNFRRNLKLVNLGRSSTLNPKYFCEDENNLKYQFPTSSSSVTPIEEEPISPLISSTPSSKSKKRHLPFSAIYRSFSEQQPDIIDESDELLNERSHSCYQVTEEKDSNDNEMKNKNENKGVNIIQNNMDSKKDDKNNISTSLPTFSTTNMMQHLKGSRNKEMNTTAAGSSGNSYGNSSSSLYMDISPCGSGSGNNSTSDPRDLYLRRKSTFLRDNSYQSDSSHCSSVDSLLESRKPDPESILINLGFGPIDSEDILAKIPKRFLKPSQVRGIDTEAFLRRQQLMNSIHDYSVLGYRGLIGNPDIPPSVIVGKIMERFEQNERNRSNYYEYNRPQSAPPSSMEIQKFHYNT